MVGWLKTYDLVLMVPITCICNLSLLLDNCIKVLKKKQKQILPHFLQLNKFAQLLISSSAKITKRPLMSSIFHFSLIFSIFSLFFFFSFVPLPNFLECCFSQRSSCLPHLWFSPLSPPSCCYYVHLSVVIASLHGLWSISIMHACVLLLVGLSCRARVWGRERGDQDESESEDNGKDKRE